MGGDYSRHTFDPKKHYSSVLMQQGRVQLDADWNAQAEILDRRLRAETTDIIGRRGVPRETPDGFKIEIPDGDPSELTIGRGRIYVNGLLAENHGKQPLEFDNILKEERGSLPLPYDEQPYYPKQDAIPESKGPHLVYLDIWQREVTSLQDPSLIEKAVGVDTTTRLQNVWQVKVLSDVGNGVTCDTPDEKIEEWHKSIQPSAGRLSTAAVGVPTGKDPCLIPPSGGYRGLENRLYRVEIHNKGKMGDATFKWSRDNGTVATAVTSIPTLDKIVVASVGRDSVLRFNPGDWVEVTDDWRELAGEPGEIRKVLSADDATRTVTFTNPLPSGEFPVDSQGNTQPSRHTRIRRWDQKGQVRDADEDLIIDLDDSNNNGLIPIPTAGTPIILEDGIQITFDANTADGDFQVGDYWSFAARTADASVEELQQAPPRGIHHHYCRLAILSSSDNGWTIKDCRDLFPPLTNICAEDVCYHDDKCGLGVTTVQEAIDQLCEREDSRDPGIHVKDVRFTDQSGSFLNDTNVPIIRLQRGIEVVCDREVDEISLHNQQRSFFPKPTCFVTVEIPVDIGSMEALIFQRETVVGYIPIKLAAFVEVNEDERNIIVWRPADQTVKWLGTLINRFAKVLAHLTLKGNFIWATERERLMYLDGEMFGQPKDRRTGTLIEDGIPSGDGRRGGDFEMWFWLVPERININRATLGEFVVLLREVGVAETTALTLANAIMRTRTERPFTRAEDLIRVPGLGERTLEKIIDRVTI
jgi:hypothetical protein